MKKKSKKNVVVSQKMCCCCLVEGISAKPRNVNHNSFLNESGNKMKLNTTHIEELSLAVRALLISKSKRFPKKMFTLSQIWMPLLPLVFEKKKHKVQIIATPQNSPI